MYDTRAIPALTYNVDVDGWWWWWQQQKSIANRMEYHSHIRTTYIHIAFHDDVRFNVIIDTIHKPTHFGVNGIDFLFYIRYVINRTLACSLVGARTRSGWIKSYAADQPSFQAYQTNEMSLNSVFRTHRRLFTFFKQTETSETKKK